MASSSDDLQLPALLSIEPLKARSPTKDLICSGSQKSPQTSPVSQTSSNQTGSDCSFDSWISYDEPEKELQDVESEIVHVSQICRTVHQKWMESGSKKYSVLYRRAARDLAELLCEKEKLEEIIDQCI
jgi:hypothetical protein